MCFLDIFPLAFPFVEDYYGFSPRFSVPDKKKTDLNFRLDSAVLLTTGLLTIVGGLLINSTLQIFPC